jgi:tRNA modification GTPase
VIDSVVLTKFTSPNSYTGEDIIEISCHGGSAVKNAILDALFSMGARPAEPGEFSKHAFLNGKMDLAQAEAVMDLIGSTAQKAELEAIRQLQGVLSKRLRAISKNIYTVMSKIEMIVEFPEHEETDEAAFAILSGVKETGHDLDRLLSSFQKGRVLREGLNVVIAGRPNAGKSSMLNTLAGYDRAIVTSIPGTTRDTIEEFVDIDGLPVRLVDTAGLRQSDDEVESAGIGRARRAMEEADIVFWIAGEDEIDPDGLMDKEEDLREILSCHQEKSLILILGKSDLSPYAKNKGFLQNAFPDTPIISFSSVTMEGVEDVRDIIMKKYEELGASGSEEVLITNARHYHALVQAKKSAELVIHALEQHIPLDIAASTLRSVADSLAQITGDLVSEELVNEIFSRFCIGK